MKLEAEYDSELRFVSIVRIAQRNSAESGNSLVEVILGGMSATRNTVRQQCYALSSQALCLRRAAGLKTCAPVLAPVQPMACARAMRQFVEKDAVVKLRAVEGFATRHHDRIESS